MLKKLLIITTLNFTLSAHAETCPTPTDLKNHFFHNWQILNADSGEPLSPEKREKFIEKVRAFAYAGWLEDAPEGSGECFYHGSTRLNVYLAKHTLKPDPTDPFWHKQSDFFMRCDAGVMACRFKD